MGWFGHSEEEKTPAAVVEVPKKKKICCDCPDTKVSIFCCSLSVQQVLKASVSDYHCVHVAGCKGSVRDAERCVLIPYWKTVCLRLPTNVLLS